MNTPNRIVLTPRNEYASFTITEEPEGPSPWNPHFMGEPLNYIRVRKLENISNLDFDIKFEYSEPVEDQLRAENKKLKAQRDDLSLRNDRQENVLREIHDAVGINPDMFDETERLGSMVRTMRADIDQLRADKSALEGLFQSARQSSHDNAMQVGYYEDEIARLKASLDNARKEAQEQGADAQYHAERVMEANSEIGRLTVMHGVLEEKLRNIARVVAQGAE